jgi:soluble lytic murein transglycosylase-like protein
MQLMPEVQRELSVADPFDPIQSVEGGAKLLRSLIDRYAGDLSKALAAYNAGPGAVDRAGGIPPIPETTNYVAKIAKRIE